MRRLLTFLFCFAALAALSAPAQATPIWKSLLETRSAISFTVQPILYVANSTGGGFTSGSDSNTYAQAQSKSTPWLTVNKALVNAVAGDDIRVWDGTYGENTASGVLQVSRTMGSMTTVESDSGTAANVIIQGTSGTTKDVAIISGASNWKFKNVTFGGRTGNTGNTIVASAGNESNLYFDHDIFSVMTGSAYLSSFATTPVTVSGITFDTCTVGAISGQVCAGGFTVNSTVSGNTEDSITVKGCTIVTNSLLAGDGISLIGTNLLVTGNTVTMASTNAAYHGIITGVDGTAGFGNCTGTISNNNVNTVNGHDIILGAGPNGTLGALAETCYGNTTRNGLHGIISKGIGTAIVNNRIIGGPNAQDCIYFKNAVFSEAVGNIGVGKGMAVASKVFECGPDSVLTTIMALDITSEDNTFLADSSGGVSEYVHTESGATNSTGTVGGDIIDYNSYGYVNPPSTEGNILGTGYNTLALAVAGWTSASYATTGNDSHSVEYPVRNAAFNATTATTSTTPGLTVYEVVQNSTRTQFWNSLTQSFEAYNAANWPYYALPLWEKQAGYYVTMAPLQATGGLPTYYAQVSATSGPLPTDAFANPTRTGFTGRTGVTVRSSPASRTATSARVLVR